MGDARPYLEVNTLLLRYQRKRWLLGLQSGRDIAGANVSANYAEEGVLLSLYCEGDKNVKELAEDLGIERSWMSRIVSGLEQRRLVRSYVPEIDKRSKRIRLAAKGKELFLVLSGGAGETIDLANRELSDTQRKRLLSGLEVLADGLGAKTLPGAKKLNPIYVELWRLSRVVGITGDNFMGTGLSLTQFHVIQLIQEQGGESVIARELDRLLPFDASTLSRTLGGFETDKMITRVASADDRRAMLIRFADSGRKLVSKLEQQVEGVMRKALDRMSREELAAFVAVLELVCAEMPVSPGRSLRDRIDVRPLGPKAREEALVDLLNSESPAVRQRARETDECFGMYVNAELRALACFNARSKKSNLDLLLVGSQLDPRECLAFLRSCLRTTRDAS